MSGDGIDGILAEYFSSTSLAKATMTDKSKRILLRKCRNLKHLLLTSVEVPFSPFFLVEMLMLFQASIDFDVGEDTHILRLTKAKFEDLIREYVLASVGKAKQFVDSNIGARLDLLVCESSKV